jgi:hypothetical protein
VEASRRQLALLGAILVVGAGMVYWQSTRSELTPEEFSAAAGRSAPGPAGVPDAPAAARSRASATSPIPAVQLSSLDLAQPEPADSGRDPFRFESAPAAAPRSGTPGPGAGAPPPAPPEMPVGPPPPPPIPLKFIGIARQGAGRLYAVLRDERGVYYGAEGDVVEGRYRIHRVSADTVEVSYVDGRGRVSIPLSGGRP